MAENYSIKLGVQLDTSDIASQINAAEKKVDPIKIKIDAETKELTNTIKEALKSLSSGAKNELTLDTTKIESSFKDIHSTIKEIKTSLGTLDSKSGMKSLLSSINKISAALEKASNQFDSLNANLNALSGKDLSLNLGINLGGSNNPIARNATYGSKVRNETLPQLKQQAEALENYLKQYYKVADGFNAAQKLLQGTNAGSGKANLYDLLPKMLDSTGSLSSQMTAWKEYIALMKEAAGIKGVDLSSVTSQFSQSADKLVQDAQDVQTGANEAKDAFEKLKQVFGGSGIDADGLSKQLDSIVTDLNEIKTTLQGLSSGVSLDGLTQSFDRLSNSIELLIQNCGNVKTAINDSVDGLGGSVGQSGSGLKNVESDLKQVTVTADNTADAIKQMQDTMSRMKFDRSSIDMVAKDLENLGVEISKISLKDNGANLDVTVKGIDTVGRAVTEIRRLDKATDEISPISKTFTQSFETSADVAKKTQREINEEVKKFINLQKQIENTRFEIGKLEIIGNSTNQIEELQRELRELESTYDSLMQAFMKKVSINADIIPFHDVVDNLDDGIAEATKRAETRLEQFKAKYADARAELAKDIKLNIELGNFDDDISKMYEKFNRLSDASKDLRESIEQVKNAYREMELAAGTDDDVFDAERIIKAQEEYARALEKTNNLIRMQAREEKVLADAQKLQDDRQLFQSNIDSWLTKNSAAAEKFGDKMLELKAKAENCDRVELNHLISEFKKLDKEADKAGYKMQSFSDRIKTKLKEYGAYFSVAEVFMYVTQGLKDMFNQVVAIDSAMTELKKVTNETDSSYDQFLSNAASRAKELGITIDGIVASAADFARLGYEFKDVQGLAEVANIYSVVGDDIDSVETATQSLISTMTAFKDEMNGLSDSDFALSVVDKFNEVSNNFAISSGGIGEALQRSASSMAAANNSLDETIALITAANTVVQDPDAVGRLMPTLKVAISVKSWRQPRPRKDFIYNY